MDNSLNTKQSITPKIMIYTYKQFKLGPSHGSKSDPWFWKTKWIQITPWGRYLRVCIGDSRLYKVRAPVKTRFKGLRVKTRFLCSWLVKGKAGRVHSWTRFSWAMPHLLHTEVHIPAGLTNLLFSTLLKYEDGGPGWCPANGKKPLVDPPGTWRICPATGPTKLPTNCHRTFAEKVGNSSLAPKGLNIQFKKKLLINDCSTRGLKI